MRTNKRGFTIVELLIVIVVIGILAAIGLAGYTGVQQKARDSARTSAVRQIQRALEAYRAEHGVYPPRIGISTNTPPGFIALWGAGYDYSVDTRNNWLQPLINANVITEAPKDPINDSSHHFIYYSATSIGACQEPMYMLAVAAYERTANIPADSKALVCTGGGVTANWSTTSSRAVFSNIPR